MTLCVYYSSTYSLNTWTRPPPALTLSARVPASASCRRRVAWVVTLPVVLRQSWWPPSNHILLCVCWGTVVFVCLTSLPFVSSWWWQRQWILYLQPQRQALFSGSWSQCFTAIPHSTGDGCDHWRKRAGPELVGAEQWGVGTSRGASTYGWNQCREASFTVVTPCRQYCTRLVGTGDLSCWGVQESKTANVSGQTALALQSLRCFPLSHFCQCIY